MLLCMFSSCTLAPLECFLNFSDYHKKHEFAFSKEELKDRILEAYSYDENLFVKNLGKTLIESENVNKKYRKSVDLWLDKGNWDKFKSEIKQNTSDTFTIIIVKYHSRKLIQLDAIIQGNNNKSSLTIHKFKYQQRKACNREKEHYILTIYKKPDKKFIRKLTD